MKAVTLNLPDELYAHIEEIAQTTNRPIEAVLTESLDLLFLTPSSQPDLEERLQALVTMPDEQLWAIVHYRLPIQQSLRLQELNRIHPLSDTQRQELETLLATVDENMLVRSEALSLLQKRGHDIRPYFYPSEK